MTTIQAFTLGGVSACAFIGVAVWLARVAETRRERTPKRHHWLVRRWCYVPHGEGPREGYYVQLHDGRILWGDMAIVWREWPTGDHPWPWPMMCRSNDVENFIRRAAREYRDAIRCDAVEMGIVPKVLDTSGSERTQIEARP